MNNFDSRRLSEALQDLKESYLLSIARRLISRRIPDQEVITLARMLPASKVVSQLKRSYFKSYVWNKLKRQFR